VKRSRRIFLTMMGTAAVGAATTGFVPRKCGPGQTAVRTIDGSPLCRATSGGFGGTLQYVHGHDHGHAGG